MLPVPNTGRVLQKSDSMSVGIMKQISRRIAMVTRQTRTFRIFVYVAIWLLSSHVATAQSSTILLNGHIVTPTGVVRNGWLLLQDSKIVSVSSAKPNVQTALVIESDDYVFPGFVDLHNHPMYNIFPRWTPPRQYNNRYEWRGDAAYHKAISQPEAALLPDEFCDIDEFSEVKGLIGGTTTVIGISKPRQLTTIPGCIAGLARNLDWYTGFYGTALGQEPVANAIGITPPGDVTPNGDMSPQDAQMYRQNLQSGQLKLFVIHIAEGKRNDAQSKTEFGLLKNAQLLTPNTVIVHGVALSAQDFAEMSQIGASLVWSPRSNIELYGETTDIQTALQQVSVALAPDWSPTGSNNMLAELKYASKFSASHLNGALSPQQLFAMATSIPARIAKIDDKVGSIAPGLYADVFMMKGSSTDAYVSLVSASPQDVSLVIVNGVPVYGTSERLGQVGVVSTEDVMLCGTKRSINSQGPSNGSLSSASARLSQKLSASQVTLGPIVECP
jgi:5-methylthioadenosine/S-adenosylhomocysteine deaminase